MANGNEYPIRLPVAPRERSAAERLQELERSMQDAGPGRAQSAMAARCKPLPGAFPPEHHGRQSFPRIPLSTRMVAGLAAAYKRLVRAVESSAYPPLGELATGPEAITTLTRTLAIQPHNCLAWFQLGMAYLQQNSFQEAVTSFTRAHSFGYDTYELHFYAAEAQAALGNHEQAVQELYRAMDRQPEAAEPAYRLGLSLSALGRLEEAAAAFRIAVSLSPCTVRYHQSLGLTLESLGQRDEAIRCFKAAVSLDQRVG